LVIEKRGLIMQRILSILIVVLFSSNVFAMGTNRATQETSESSSFENDLEGWTVNGTDLNLGARTIDWSITRSQEMAKDGSTSLKFVLINQNDAGKIWIEKPFAVEPNHVYDVTIEYAFASRIFNAGLAFQVITGVLKTHPTTGRDLYPAFKDLTWNGSDSNVGFTWQDKSYEFTARSDEEGLLYVVIGIWGTGEVGHIYYFDDVRVTLTKKPEGSQFYSFENDLQGWSSKGADLEFGSGFVDWSVTRAQEYLDGEDGVFSMRFELNNLNGKAKIWIEKPFSVEPGRKYKVSVDYALHSQDCGDIPRFRIITGVFRSPPQTGDDLVNAFQEKTTSTGCTWGWLHKTYDFTIKSKKKDTLYVVIGIWGTRTTHRAYNVDSVCVTLVPK
jgi:hypothetical protein